MDAQTPERAALSSMLNRRMGVGLKSEIGEVRKRAALARERVALQQAVEIFICLGSEPLSELSAETHEKNLKALLAKKHEGLRAAAEILERGEPLPDLMRLGVARYLREAGRTPQRESYREGRNALIVEVIEYVRDYWCFPATRNAATDRASAALIAKRALGDIGIHTLTESAINSIWREWAPARALSAGGGWPHPAA
jgi:hypothetical protein